MTENEKKILKEQLFQIWENNAIFRDNIAYLTQVQLRFPEPFLLDILERVEDFYYYELLEEATPPLKQLNILNREESLDLLLENPKSFCRFGDGELMIVAGMSIPFQIADKNLALRLQEILASSKENCYVGINYEYYHSTRKLDASDRRFIRIGGKNLRRVFNAFINKKRLYLDSCAFLRFPENTETVQEKLNHFEKLKNLFKNRKLVIISGSTVFEKFQYNIFEKAESRIHVFTSSKNAWSQYREILEHAKTYTKDYTICAILGPTATVLAYDLAQEGYTAWDIGHMAKWYDAHIKKLHGSATSFEHFYDPD